MRKDQKSWDEYHKWDKEFCTDAAPTYWDCWQAARAVAQAETYNVTREVGHKAPSPPETIWLSFRGIENGECTVVRWSTEQESDSDVLYTPVFRPVCDWKTEYSRAVELHNQTLDELQHALQRVEIYKKKLDELGLAIVDAGYPWTPEMRKAYELGIKE